MTQHTPPELLEIFEALLNKENIRQEPQNLYDPVNYILSLGGKRIRPVMTLMACELFGGDIKKAMPAALGIEMFHNFSLVHDDIMDRAPLRRGKPTVHERWNANAAILSGDTMLVMAYDLFLSLEPHKVLPVMAVFSQTAREVCEGQQYDMDFETRAQVTIGEYLEMIRLKTAVLIGAAFRIGGIMGGADPDDLERIYRFGMEAGIAFQLMDDLLDTYGNEAVFGKRKYGDIHTNKKTFLYLKALELADEDQAKTLARYYSPYKSDPDEKIREVMKIFDLLDVKSRTESLISHYHDRAIESFERIGVTDDRKKVILDYTEKLMARSY